MREGCFHASACTPTAMGLSACAQTKHSSTAHWSLPVEYGQVECMFVRGRHITGVCLQQLAIGI